MKVTEWHQLADVRPGQDSQSGRPELRVLADRALGAGRGAGPAGAGGKPRPPRSAAGDRPARPPGPGARPLQHPPAGGRGGHGRAAGRAGGQELGPDPGLRPALGAAGPARDPQPSGRRPPLRLRPGAGGLRARLAAAVRAGLGSAGRRLGAGPRVTARGSRRRASRSWRCITSTAPCPGWRRFATSWSARSSSRAAICSRARSTWCSSTPPRSTSTATA
jgi:hypothetical protein